MAPRTSSASLLASSAVLLAALVQTATAHGAMTDPRYRGCLATYSLTLPDLGLTDIDNDDCPHCLNGGGKGAVMKAAKNNWRPWEPLSKTKPFRHDAGLCGDPISDPVPRAHEKGGKFGPPKSMPYSAVYKAGQIVKFEADVTTNHNGFFEFFICNVGKCGGDISDKCFQQGHCKQMMRAPVPECEGMKSKECGPIDPAYPGRWIVPCRKGGHVGEHFMGGVHMQYKLPAGFVCEDCVIQWYWATANSCNPPGFKEYFEKFPMPSWGKCPGDGGAFGARNPTLATCGGPNFPEEFWSCLDARVTGTGVTGPARAPKKVETRKAVPQQATQNTNGKTPIVMTTEKSPAPKPTPSSSPAPPKPPAQKQRAQMQPAPQQTAQKPVSGAAVADGCATQSTLEFREPGETTPDPVGAKCAGNWKQCGGLFHKGATSCCNERYECVPVNKYFAQCKAPPRRR